MPLNKDVGNWIKDFMKSNAPQFKGKSKEERRDMALAAYREKYGALEGKEGATAAEEDKFHRELDKLVHKTFGHSSDEKKEMEEGMDVNHMKLISLVKSADNPKNLPIYYNSGHNVVNIGGTGYDKGELVQKFNSEPGQSSDIKSLFYKADKSAEETVDMINGMNAGIKAELKYGYGNEPFVVYKKEIKEMKEENNIEGFDANNDLVKIFMIMVKDMVEKEENPTPESFNKAKETILKYISREDSPLHMAARFVKNEMGILEEAKPDFLDLDKDGNTTEPMKKAAKDAKKEAIEKAMKKVSEVIKVKSPEEAAKVNKLDPDAEVVVDPKALTEGRNYDYEGKMAHSQLLSIVKNARDLFNMIDQDSQLKAWVQSKLTKAEDYLDSVRVYLEGESLGNTAPAMFENEAIKDETGTTLSIGDVVKGGDGKMYQIVYSYSEGIPMMVPFDLKRKKITSLRDKVYFNDDSSVNKKLSKVLDFSATKGGFMK